MSCQHRIDLINIERIINDMFFHDIDFEQVNIITNLILNLRDKMIQSILFDKRYFTLDTSVDWLVKHGYRYYKLDITDKYIRARQFNPSLYKKYRTISFGTHIKAIVAF